MKGHYIARTLTGLTGIGLIAYSIWLRTQQAIVVADGQAVTNTIALVAVMLLGVYFILLVAHPKYVPSNRWMLAVQGIVIIFVAQSLFLDTPEQYIYLKDILKIIGASLVVTGPMKLLTTKEAEQKKFMDEVEIIEV